MPTELYPVGTVLPFGGGTPPSGWLLCNGAAVSRTGRADLFAVIGTDFGAGDGSTTFNLPDARVRFPLGAAAIAGGGTGGAVTHTHSAASHPHTATQPGAHGTHNDDGAHTHDSHTTATRTAGLNPALNSPTTHVSDGSGTHDAHSAHSGFAITDGGSGTTSGNNPPFLGFDFIIAAFNTFTVSFDLAQEHAITRTLRVRRTVAVAQEHAITRTLRVRRTVAVAQEHAITLARKIVAFREFELAQEHAITLAAVKIFVRTFNLAQEHDVTARVCVDFNDVPTGGGPSTVKKIIYLFDD